MRKLIIVLCALFVLAGCGSVAKEVTPQASDKTTSPTQTTANASVIVSTSSSPVTESIATTPDVVVTEEAVVTPSSEVSVNITVTNNHLVMEITSEDSVLETLVASQSLNGDYEVLPEGSVLTVPQSQSQYAEGMISNGQEICQVSMTSATEVFSSTEPESSVQMACAETKEIPGIY